MNTPKIALLVVIGMMILGASFYLSLTILTLLGYHCDHYRDRYVDRDRVGRLGEMQTSLNVIWKAKPQGTTVSRLIARAASLGLVAALGFLLMVSLVVSIVLTAFGNYLDSILP